MIAAAASASRGPSESFWSAQCAPSLLNRTPLWLYRCLSFVGLNRCRCAPRSISGLKRQDNSSLNTLILSSPDFLQTGASRYETQAFFTWKRSSYHQSLVQWLQWSRIALQMEPLAWCAICSPFWPTTCNLTRSWLSRNLSVSRLKVRASDASRAG